MFKAKQVDAAVTWEPDLSGAVTARGDEAHVLVSTSAATNIIADTLCARQDIIERAPETLRDFVHGWFEGIEMMKADPAASYAVVGKALKLDSETVSGMLSGLKLTPFADNAQFYGLTGGRAHYETLFDTAFVIWRKKGLVTRPVDAKDWADTRFISALAQAYPGQGVQEPAISARPASAQDRAIINKQIQIHFTPGSDVIMEGSFFVLDALGETMTSFGNTYLRVEGNTDSVGAPGAQPHAVGAPGAGREELRPEELPEHPARPVPDHRPRRGESGGAQHDRGRAAAEPPHGHQGRSGRAVERWPGDHRPCSRSDLPCRA